MHRAKVTNLLQIHGCSLSFYWPQMHRAIRVLGWAERVPRSVSQAYFDTRPVGSRIGAWASPQSQVIPSRESLESLIAACQRNFDNPTSDDAHIPVPDHWGGYIVVPDEIEFWIGRTNRLHGPVSVLAQSQHHAACLGCIVLGA
ncbi:hypothetical protein MGL_1830 [Malassezia globosa CBS 7966]|uniref:pyridoxal 5'-phosphate synthase n=1 Tax=Malassezia globosa (strain ATCC MYA-4612 / CBS 7966) TaxID=425265 RepID=A8Q1S1_MALGO|nr:uncharacterized protein MGL_1830 [Malassezia globosa CBS 7966]EDP43617.1 hypothetical protein MGL_1830 [Malassezia globosa CBS 7966]